MIIYIVLFLFICFLLRRRLAMQIEEGLTEGAITLIVLAGLVVIYVLFFDGK